MGRIEHTSEGGVSTRGRRLGRRPCLRKGCGRSYQARHFRQRYCRERDCLRELRRWQVAKRQRKRRATAEGRQKHAQAERERRRRNKDLGSSPGNATPCSHERARGHAKSRAEKIISGAICDRPGCYEPPRASARRPACYCGGECAAAMRRVQDRERKWKTRKTKAGRLKRRLEYQAAQRRRGQPRHTARSSDHGDSRQAASPDRGHAVGFYGHPAKRTLTSPYPQKAPTHDQQRSAPSQPRPPPSG
jgi:hypothetical protein